MDPKLSSGRRKRLMASPYWMKTLIKKIYGARFFVSGLTHYRPIGWLIDRLLFKDDNVVFVPKDTVIAVNEEAGAPTGVAAPSEIVEHFIREASFIWIMDFCICRDSEKCGDYPVSYGCIFLGPAAAGINPGFGRPARVEEAVEQVDGVRKARIDLVFDPPWSTDNISEAAKLELGLL